MTVSQSLAAAAIPPPWELTCTQYARERNDRLLATWWRLYRKALRQGVI